MYAAYDVSIHERDYESMHMTFCWPRKPRYSPSTLRYYQSMYVGPGPRCWPENRFRKAWPSPQTKALLPGSSPGGGA